MVHGSLNEKVCDLLLDQIKRGTQIGTQVAAYRHGDMVVDAWAGAMGPEDTRPVQPDTLFSSFSTTKACPTFASGVRSSVPGCTRSRMAS